MEKDIRLIFSGDFAPMVEKNKQGNLFSEELLIVIQSYNLHIANLECPLTDSEIKIKKAGRT